MRVLRGQVGNREATGLELPLTGQKVAFEREDRIVVGKVAGRNVLQEQVRALSRVEIEGSQGTTVITYSFAQDKDGNPSIEFSGEAPDDRKRKPSKESASQTTLVAWDSGTGKILSDSNGAWRYDAIATPENPWEYAAIGRTNDKGEKEFWHRDTANGEEITIFKDGSKQVETWFVAGELKNRLRERTLTKNGVTTILYKPFYGPNKEIIRSIINGRTVIPHKLPDGGIFYEEVEDLKNTTDNIKNMTKK